MWIAPLIGSGLFQKLAAHLDTSGASGLIVQHPFIVGYS